MTAENVERTLGILLAKVEGIEKSIQRGDEHRATVHRRVDDLVDEVGDLKTELATMKADVKDTKAVTDDVKKWKLMGMGALGVTGIAAGFIGSAATAYWSDIVKFFRHG